MVLKQDSQCTAKNTHHGELQWLESRRILSLSAKETGILALKSRKYNQENTSYMSLSCSRIWLWHDFRRNFQQKKCTNN